MDSIFNAFADAMNGAVRYIFGLLQALLLLPPMIPPGTWQYLLFGGIWGMSEILAILVVIIAFVGLPFALRRRWKMFLQTVLFAVLVIFFGGLFFKFCDAVQAVSIQVTAWVAGLGGPTQLVGVISAPSTVSVLISIATVAASGYYGVIILVVFYVLLLLSVLFKLLFLPLLLLMPFVKWVKSTFDWLVTIGFIALAIGAPVIVGILKLGLFANQQLGGKGAVGAIGATIALLASLVIAKRWLIQAIKNTHSFVSAKSDAMTAEVRGRVETHWTQRPEVDVNRVRQSAPPPPAVGPAETLPKRVMHNIAAEGTVVLAAKIAASMNPVGLAATLGASAIAAGAESVVDHHKKKADLQ